MLESIFTAISNHPWVAFFTALWTIVICSLIAAWRLIEIQIYHNENKVNKSERSEDETTV